MVRTDMSGCVFCGALVEHDGKTETLFLCGARRVKKTLATVRPWACQELARMQKLEKVHKLASELCGAIDMIMDDIGGHRTVLQIVGELGPAVDAAKRS